MPTRTPAAPSKAKRAAPKPRAVKAAPVKAPAQTKARAASPAKKTGVVTPRERLHLIAEAAYFRAERRAFRPGDDLADWLEAEAEIDTLLNSRGAG